MTDNQAPDQNKLIEDILLREAEELLAETDPSDVKAVDVAFNKIADLIAGMDSAVKVEFYINKISKDYDISLPLLRKVVKIKQNEKDKQLKHAEKLRVEREKLEAEQEKIAEEKRIHDEQKEAERIKSIQDYITRNTVDGVLWKADLLLQGIDNSIVRNEKFTELAHTIALLPGVVAREDYAVKIGKKHDLQPSVFKKMIADAMEIRNRQAVIKRTVRKNKITALDGNAKVYPFFEEMLTKDGKYKDIKINKVKFVDLLASFGFTRFEVGENDNYTFVRLQDNIIKTVTRDEIIDYVENFVRKEYDFDAAGIEHVNPEILINKFYDGMRSYFSKDLFARVRVNEKIIINKDKAQITYLYYQNGFVEVTKEGATLRPYSEMEGSVWEHQMLDRNFTLLDLGDDLKKFGFFADFCFKLANQDADRFKALCCIIGYLIHDFYEYKLKAIMFTDSSLSENSEGRTGKTLISKMIGNIRSYCEINGKQFDSTSITKYQEANLSTQVLHINDVQHKGRFKFNFEDVFNDITEGYIVKKLYMPVFRQYSKMILSTNKTLNIQGGSQRDRIVEFEVSSFFSEDLSPGDHYKHWFPERDTKTKSWDESEFNRFDNFMCFCARLFHLHGLIMPETINLGERKLINHTSTEFIEFMDGVRDSLRDTSIPWTGYPGSFETFRTTCPMHEFAFDKGYMYARLLEEYPDLKSWLKQKTFSNWLVQFSTIRFNIKLPKQWKSNGRQYIQFIDAGWIKD